MALEKGSERGIFVGVQYINATMGPVTKGRRKFRGRWRHGLYELYEVVWQSSIEYWGHRVIGSERKEKELYLLYKRAPGVSGRQMRYWALNYCLFLFQCSCKTFFQSFKFRPSPSDLMISAIGSSKIIYFTRQIWSDVAEFRHPDWPESSRWGVRRANLTFCAFMRAVTVL